MFKIFNNLAKIVQFKANSALEDANAVDLIDLKIRESEQNLSAAKNTLASLIVRQRAEEKSHGRIVAQIKDLEGRAIAALDAGKTSLAQDAAEAIAELENEARLRADTLKMLEERIGKIQLSIEKAHRRLVSLRQGALAAKAAVVERKAQKRIDRSLNSTSTFKEAEDLIARVTSQSDPFEEAGVLDEIDAGLTKDKIADRMAEQGFGPATKSRADDVLARLSAKTKTKKAS